MTGRAEVGIWSIGPSVYLPSLLFGIGQGAIAPVIPLSARELGGSVATAGLVVALLGVGKIVGDLPAGVLAVRLGERRAMLLALGVVLAALAACLLAPSVHLLAVAVVFIGISSSVFGLARHAYVTEAIPFELRGRALSTLGGTQRIGLFAGPFLGAAVMSRLGVGGGYWVHIVVAVAAIVVLVVVPEPPPAAHGGRAAVHRSGKPESTARVIRRHLTVLRTLGVGALLVGAARASRQVAIPLWGEHLGLDPATVSLLFGVSGAMEMLIFYPAGYAMDRLGRRRIVVPSMVLLGLSLVLLPLTNGIGTYTAVALLMGFGNGLGSGIIMTIGSDVSPDVSRATFLGAWRLFADVGNGVGPVLVSAVTAAVTLGAAIATAGAVAFVAAALMAHWVPKNGAVP
ncbi:MFS transporter [Jiangella alkaliphila]|uniref:Predicted arabinose efflux permease, MFS family n=1 Tax=Jiangella alkaliphila TaxID=419479 RepID=A0A1H2HUU1_9ACTN|nr:MFS transporter [Jiangella alkaliphila]SDU35298.1 Predicted arabinose efflux permease, MFS family [Jiangella alkaliphila]